ncbi:anhydro-N-acetylmuramic acid kinase [Tianweitania sediminis]|uniref:Anhydro-N-acetylmuramic acid kinase n=1 Tax=Tianweitania sediminis TaxID=1502156 RepID=A0A8J7R3E7_9HYPH|nr:anhydro-N-acetylmuramic acid kinase [Tianweitania sediminis]MBP0441002.1 anhydro-N-acetylmuramic acid kinase [Tianweitania sediminis]
MVALTTAIGLMSGTSMDGIDVAVLRTDGEAVVQQGPSLFVPYDDAFRARIEAGLKTAKTIAKRAERPGDLAELERDLTLRHAQAVQAFRTQYQDWRAELVGFHGQTILHRPGEALTVQLGDGALLARETGLPVVYDMRAADMTAGGQGAPLVPAYHQALANSLAPDFRAKMPVAFVNIGGISNVTYVPADGDPIAFDSGPGNQLIDQWMQREGDMAFDEDGNTAAKGSSSAKIVGDYLRLPFFSYPAPKSLDRGDFSLAGLEGLSLSDGARTLAALAAEAVFAARNHMPEEPELWILCGGGRKNPHIVGDLRRLAGTTGTVVVAAEDVGLDGDAMEAEAWAYLAVRSQQGLPLTWPATTGCRKPMPGGVLVQP